MSALLDQRDHKSRFLLVVLVAVLVAGSRGRPLFAATGDVGEIPDALTRTRNFILAVYPELGQRRDLVIWFETVKVPFMPDRDVFLNGWFGVVLAPSQVIHAEHDPKAPRVAPVLGANVSVDRVGAIVHFQASGNDILHTSQRRALQDRLDAHPELTQVEFSTALDQSEMKFPPSKRQAFQERLRPLLERLEKQFGRFRGVQLTFLDRNDDNRDKGLPSATLVWTLNATVTNGDTVSEVVMSFEPFGGELIFFDRMPQSKSALR
jgi:hypothetical protein